MPAKDIIHQAVRNALEKDGWVITDDPLFVSFAQVQMYIDLGAERLLAAEKNGRRIAVEIKSFLGSSALSEFHLALGQFLSYRLALETQQPDRILYLAIPTDAYDGFFRLEFGHMVVQRYQIKLIVFDVQNEVIYKWQP